MTEPRTVMEALVEARHASDLTHRPTRCPVDLIGALGAAGITGKLGTSLIDFDLLGTEIARKELENLVLQAVKRMQGKGMTPMKARSVARSATDIFASPPCPTCHGRGHTGVEQQITEKWVSCDVCRGTGRVTRKVLGGPDGVKLTRPCGHCHGKGRVRQVQTPQAYKPRACGTCGGTGRKPLPQKHQDEVRAMVTIMEDARRAAMLSVRRQMGMTGSVVD